LTPLSDIGAVDTTGPIGNPPAGSEKDAGRRPLTVVDSRRWHGAFCAEKPSFWQCHADQSGPSQSKAMLRPRTVLIAILGLIAGGGATAALYRTVASVSEVHPAKVWEGIQAAKQLGPDDWPCWRGPLQDGIHRGRTLPTHWSATENVAWKHPVAGLGHSTPVTYGDKLFLTTATAEPPGQSVICLSLSDGRQLWETPVHNGALPKTHEKNSHASATPVTDGRHVYVIFAVDDSVWATSLDLDGKIVWQTNAGPFISLWGYGSSPALYRGLLIVSADNRGSKLNRLRATSFLTALNAETGEIVWRVQRPEEHSFGTPVVATVGGRTQVLLHGAKQVAGYVPETGDVLWEQPCRIERSANSPVFSEDHVYCSGTFPDKEALAITVRDGGAAVSTSVEWTSNRYSCDVPSPVLADGHLYMVQDGGVLFCVNPADGQTLWRKRLKGNYSSSPLLSGNRLYISGETGVTSVLDISKEGESIAENDLGDAIFASPIPVGNRLIIRTTKDVWCLSPKSDHDEPRQPGP
jgi:outer membrane protein assembly factor BamB